MIYNITLLALNKNLQKSIAKKLAKKLGMFFVDVNDLIKYELEDIKTAVNEAVTNVIVHAYPEKPGIVTIKATTNKNKVEINISDNGVGIQDIERALTPFYTSKPDQERSGMGFTVMESFMDKLVVSSKNGGVCVSMMKEIEQEVVGL